MAEDSKKTPITPAPLVKREAEVSGKPSVQNEIIRDREVSDAGVKEIPAPELTPHVEIVNPQVTVPLASQSVTSTRNASEELSSEISKIPTFAEATQGIKGRNFRDSIIGLFKLVVKKHERKAA